MSPKIIKNKSVLALVLLCIYWIILLLVVYLTENVTEFLVQTTATLFGVFIAFYLSSELNNILNEKKEKRKRSILLVFLKSEILANYQATVNIISAAKRQISLPQENLSDFLKRLIKGFHDETFHSMQNVGYFTSIRNDKYFNLIFEIYARIQQIKHFIELMAVDEDEFKNAKKHDIEKAYNAVLEHSQGLQDAITKAIKLTNEMLKSLDINSQSIAEKEILSKLPKKNNAYISNK